MRLNKKTKNTVGVGVGIVGFVSSIVGLFAISIPIGIVFLVGTALAMVLIFYIIPQDNLPDGMDAIVEEMENHLAKKTMKVIFPCDSKYFQAANKLAKEKFGKNSVSTRTVNDWKKRMSLFLPV